MLTLTIRLRPARAPILRLLTPLTLTMLLAVFAIVAPAVAQDIVGDPLTGVKGIVVTVEEMMRQDQETLRVHRLVRESPPASTHRRTTSEGPFVANWRPEDLRPFVDEGCIAGAPEIPQTVGVSFLAAQTAESGWVPPDSMGGVSEKQVLVHVNGRVKVFSKIGALGALNVTDLTFWNSVRNGFNVGNPQVRYDRLSDRWFLVAVNRASVAPSRVMIAVSNGSTITSTASFTFFFISVNGLANYSSLGVDPNALYIGIDLLSGNSIAYVVRKTSVVGGGPIVVTTFTNLTPPCPGEGLVSPRGVDNDDASASQGYFIGVSNCFLSRLILRRVSDPGGTPILSGNIILAVPATVFPMPTPALGSANPLSAVDDRLGAARMRKLRSTGVSTLWTAHNIQVNSSGVASSTGGRNGSRWYQLQDLSTTPSLLQSGTLFDPSVINIKNYWIPSVCMSGQGHMALGCSYAGTNDHAGVAVAGRLASDPLGAIQAATLAVPSSFTYNLGTAVPLRWGHYSETVIDPVDDMTMWTFQEYCNFTDSWGVRVLQLRAPPPAVPASCAPSRGPQGATLDVVLTGISISGSGFFDPDNTFPNHLAAVINGGGVTVNSVSFTSPTSLTLNLTIAPGATTSVRTITVTNPDGQALTSASGIFTVNPANRCPANIVTAGSSATQVDIDDLLAVISAWGACPLPCPPPCLADIAPVGGNCQVSIDDLLAVISAWGPCP